MSYIYPVNDAVQYRASISGLRAVIGKISHPPRPSASSTSGVYRVGTPYVDQFTEYESYKENWDGYGAEPIRQETITAARQLWRSLPRDLRVPDVAPGADGTIGFEWREGASNDRKIFIIEIGPGALVTARVAHPNGHIEVVSARDVIQSLLP